MIRLQLAMIILLLSLETFLFSSRVIGQGAEVNSFTVHVAAGAFDRSGTIVSCFLPARFKDGIYIMQSDDANSSIYLQVKDSKGLFILEDLKANTSKTYTLKEVPLSEENKFPLVTNELSQNSIKIKSGENDVLSYYYKESEIPDNIDPRFKRAGYIHPVFTPQGVKVTQHFNSERPHQYGIWSAWSRIEFQSRAIGFWGAQDGRIVADSLEQIWEGPVYGGFLTKHRFVDFSLSKPVSVLHEQWEVIVYQAPKNRNYHVFDINIIQTANNGNSVEIHPHSYGGINFRGHDDWIGEGKLNFISSEGFNRSEVVGQRVRWNHLSGYIEGKFAGIGLLGHPANGNNSNGVFINQNYEPFFSYGPAPLGNTLIKPGAPWVARYRFISHDGELNPEDLERLWNDYAYPPTALLKTEK